MTSLQTNPPAPADPFVYRLPDIPEKHPDDMTSFKHLAENGNVGRIKTHLGNPETTIVSGERYICAAPGGPIRYPDLLVAFAADPELYEANNGYVVSFQGKPPDLVLEIASRHTWRTDIEIKPDFYAGLGVREYWRFDETGEFHGSQLAGDHLMGGEYQPITVDELPDGQLRGYSEVLGLYLCWRQGQLDWYDPQTGDYIPSLESEQQRADAEQQRADTEQQHASAERQRADTERELRQQAEERIRQLEAELHQRE